MKLNPEKIELFIYLRGNGSEHMNLCQKWLHLDPHSEETTGDKNLYFLPQVVY